MKRRSAPHPQAGERTHRSCLVCGTRTALRRHQAPDGAFEWYCAAHDPFPAHDG